MATFNSPLWNTTLFGGAGIPGDDPPDPVIAVADILAQLYPRLHAAGAADLVFWTESELREWIIRGAQRLARAAGVFVSRATASTTGAVQSYALPVNHLSTIHCSLDGLPLRPSSTAELAALDAYYESSTGTPARWFEDTLGLATIALSPTPTGGGTLAIIHHTLVDALTAPAPVKGYLADAALAAAYAKDSEMMAPEIAAHLMSKLALYETVFQKYWGVSQ